MKKIVIMSLLIVMTITMPRSFMFSSPVDSDPLFIRKITKIMSRPYFHHAVFGLEFFSMDNHKLIYSYNADKFFNAASTAKVITCGSALQLLGPDYRFHTRIYRTGEIDKRGTLNGDLILVASGDPNLSGRIQNDTLLFANEDHSYGGPLSVALGDPLFVINNLAKQITNHNIRRITGHVLIDASLFPQGQGSEKTLSPIVVNDNLVDVLIHSAEKIDEPASVTFSPSTSYLHIHNQIITSKPSSIPDINLSDDVENSDGSHTITLRGNLPIKTHYLFPYSVDNPVRYAGTLLVETLRRHGIKVNAFPDKKEADFRLLNKYYTANYVVAEHVSPPLSEEVKIILKLSQGLHAAIMPFLFGKLVDGHGAPQSGFDLIHKILKEAELDLSEASQNDGAGDFAHFTPHFMVNYLEHMSKTTAYRFLHDALPILGKDGTLYDIQVNSEAAGHVFGKTGTMIEGDALNHGKIVTAKALVGYMTTKKGSRIIFSIYISNVLINSDPDAATKLIGQAIGEMAAAAYETL